MQVSGAAGDHGPHAQAGRGAVPRSCGGGSPRAPRALPSSRPPARPAALALHLGSPFGLKVGHLAGHHARRAGRLGQDLHAPQRRRPRPDLARHHLERQRQEAVPGQDRRGLVERPVAGRSAAPQVVVVHRRQVVVDQRIGVHHLQRTSRRQRRLAVAAARLGRHQAQDRPQPLAAPQHAVTHRHRQPRRTRRRRGPRQPPASSRSRPPRPDAAPGPDTRPALTPRSMSWENSSCFNRFNRFHCSGAQTGRTRRIRNDELMAQHSRLGNARSSVFHARAISYASLLLTFGRRKSTQDPRKLCNAKFRSSPSRPHILPDAPILLSRRNMGIDYHAIAAVQNGGSDASVGSFRKAWPVFSDGTDDQSVFRFGFDLGGVWCWCVGPSRLRERWSRWHRR